MSCWLFLSCWLAALSCAVDLANCVNPMPVFISAILGGLIQITGSLVGRVLVALGLSTVTYSGMSTSLTWLKTQAVTAALGLPPDVIGMLSVMKVGTSISIIFSAMLARLVVTGLQGDTVKKWVLK